jgi:succinate-acetate transporter protein
MSINSAPLGLFSFAITTVCLSFLETEITDDRFIGTISSLALAYGGIVQVLCGFIQLIYENHVFEGTVFCSYGAFWLSFAYLNYMIETDVYTSNNHGQSLYLSTWGVFTFLMLTLTKKKHPSLKFTFINLTIAFFLLAIGQYHHNIKVIGGYFTMISGLGAGYTGYILLVKEVYDKKLIGY